MIVFPDWLACLSEWFRDQAELAELIDDRVFTEMPKAPELKVFPLMVVTQLTDPPIVNHPAHWAVRGLFQVDVWGGRKAETWTVAETARALTAQRLTGAHDLTAGAFVAAGVTPGGIRRTPDVRPTAGVEDDAETSKVRPRASFDFTVVLHPGIGS